MVSLVSSGLVSLSCAMLLWFSGSNLRSKANFHFDKRQTSVFFRFDPRVWQLVTLGHRRIVEHIAVISAIQFYSDPEKLKEMTFADLNEAVIQPVIAIRPRIEQFYMLSCFVALFAYSRADACESFTLKGMEISPDDWRIPATQGFVEKFINHQDIKAALYYRIAASKQGAPRYFASLASRLAEQQIDSLDDSEVQSAIEALPNGKYFWNGLKNESRKHQKIDNPSKFDAGNLIEGGMP